MLFLLPLVPILLTGCTPSVSGEVRDLVGNPQAGVVLVAEGCRAISDSRGRYTSQCPSQRYTFLIEHPGFLPTTLSVHVGRVGTTQAPPLTLNPIPSEFGFYIARNREFSQIPPALLVRNLVPEKDPDQQRYCVGTAVPTTVPSQTRLLDVHGVDWRVFRVKDDGCFYTLSRVRGSGDDAIWTWDASEIKLSSKPVGEGRFWVENTLEPGRYAIVEWLGTFVPNPGSAQNYRGWLVEVTAP